MAERAGFRVRARCRHTWARDPAPSRPLRRAAARGGADITGAAGQGVSALNWCDRGDSGQAAGRVGAEPDRPVTLRLFRGSELRWWSLDDRCGGVEDLTPVAGARRINALAVDQLFGPLGGGAGCYDPSVPALGVDGAPGPEVKNSRVPVDAQRQHGLSHEIAHDVVAGKAAHWPRMLTRHHRAVPIVDERRGRVAG